MTRRITQNKVILAHSVCRQQSLAGGSIAICDLLRGEVDRQVFEAFVERVLVLKPAPGTDRRAGPPLRPQASRRHGLIAAVGCHLLFLPTSSADLNLTEQAYAKTKQALRQVEARSSNAVVAVHDAPAAITTTDA